MTKPMPMFPLGTVLFPHATLPLHLFEERYRALAETCLRGDGRFGVVLIERGFEVGGGDQRFGVGTVARIVEAAQTPDGRYLLATVGTDRFRVRKWLDDDPFPRAEVDVIGEPKRVGDGAGTRRDDVQRLLGRVLAMSAELGDRAAPVGAAQLDDDPFARRSKLRRGRPSARSTPSASSSSTIPPSASPGSSRCSPTRPRCSSCGWAAAEYPERRGHRRRTRSALEAEQVRVEGLIGDLRGELGVSENDNLSELADYDQHPADTASETFEREKDLSILEQLEAELGELQAALVRIDEGTYGIDEVTGAPIDPARLEAYPTARTNIDGVER